jgi:hypothetical protein
MVAIFWIARKRKWALSDTPKHKTNPTPPPPIWGYPWKAISPTINNAATQASVKA